MDEGKQNTVIYKYTHLNSELEKYIATLEEKHLEDAGAIRQLYLDKIGLQKKESSMAYRISYLEQKMRAVQSTAGSVWETKYKRLLRCFNCLKAHIRVREMSVLLDSELKSLMHSGHREADSDFNLDASAESTMFADEEVERGSIRPTTESLRLLGTPDKEETPNGELETVDAILREQNLCKHIERLNGELEIKEGERRLLSDHCEEQKNQIMYLLEVIESKSGVENKNLLNIIGDLSRKNSDIKNRNMEIVLKMKGEVAEAKAAFEALEDKYEWLKKENQKYQAEGQGGYLEDTATEDSALGIKQHQELVSENARLVAQNKVVDEQLRSVEFDLNELKKEFAARGRRFEETESELRFKSIENSNLSYRNATLEKLSSDYHEKQVENSKLIFVVGQKETQVKEMTEKLFAAEEKYNKYILANEKHGALIGEVERIKAESRKTVEELHAQFADITSKDRDSRECAERLKSTIAVQQSQMAELRMAMSLKEVESKKKDAQLEALSKRIMELDSVLLEKQAQTCSLQDAMKASTDEIINKSALVRDWELKKESFALEMQKAEIEARKKDEVINELINQNSDITLKFLGRERFLMAEENKQLKQKIDFLQASINNSSVQKYEELLREYEQHRRASELDISSLRAKSREADDLYGSKVAVLSRENNQLASRCVEMEQMLVRANEALTRAPSEGLAAEQNKMASAIEDLENKLAKKEEAVQRYLAVIEKLRKVKEAYVKLRKDGKFKGNSEDERPESKQQSILDE